MDETQMEERFWKQWEWLGRAALGELRTALERYPEPNINTLAFAEESGELVQAVMRTAEGKGEEAEAVAELIQVASSIMRLHLLGDASIGCPPLCGDD